MGYTDTPLFPMTDTKSLKFEGSEEKVLLTLWHQVFMYLKRTV